MNGCWHCGGTTKACERVLIGPKTQLMLKIYYGNCEIPDCQFLCKNCNRLFITNSNTQNKIAARQCEDRRSTQTQQCTTPDSEDLEEEQPPPHKKQRKEDTLITIHINRFTLTLFYVGVMIMGYASSYFIQIETPDKTQIIHVPQSAHQVVKWLARRNYYQATKCISKNSMRARDASLEVVTQKIHQECRYYCKTSEFRGMGNFPFKVKDLYEEFHNKCPALCSILGAVVRKSAREKAGPRIVAAASILLQTRNARINGFQRLISLLLWKGKVRSLMFRRLKFFGLCSSRQAILKNLDKLNEGYDKDIRGWKEAVSKQEVEADHEQYIEETTTMECDHHHSYSLVSKPPASATSSSPSLPARSHTSSTCTRIHTHTRTRIPSGEELYPGYQLVFDNVNILQRCRHKSSSNSNNQVNLVQVYAVLDRVNMEHLPNKEPILKDIRTMDRDKWWLPPKEQVAMLEEVGVIVGRIATAYLPCLRELQEVTVKHIPHAFSDKAAVKSKVNKLGLLKLDEMFTSQVVELMSKLQCYCPRTTNDIIQVPFGGDGLSCMKSVTAQKARADGFNEEDKLQGLVPKPEDWHEGVITLQDIFNTFYKQESTMEKGTLYNLKQVFDRRGVRKSAKDAVNDNREFIKFVTHGLVVLAAMHVLGLDNLDDLPVCTPTLQEVEDKERYLRQITADVVKLIFPKGLLPSGHTSVLEVSDFKHNYICALVREGLLDIARLDAVKESDGDRIVRHWRYDFVHFNVYNHPNYRVLSFRMIAQVYGLLTPRMSARLMHNRTVNSHGGVGRNISLDLFLEFLNRDVKEDLKRSGPNLTPTLLERIGRSKQVLDELLHSFDQEVELFNGIGRHNAPDWTGEVSQMVTDLKDDHLFQIHPGRMFPSFPHFKANKVHGIDHHKLEVWVSEQLTKLHLDHQCQK